MSRPLTSTLRPLLHLSARPQPIASTSTLPISSSSSSFSTSSPAYASRAKQNAKRKKSKVLLIRQSRESLDSNPPHPVLGYTTSSPSSSRTADTSTTAGNKWEGSRLQRTILTPEDVYSAPLAGPEGKREYIHGLSLEDQQLLFGAVPLTTLSLSHQSGSSGSSSSVGAGEAGVVEQERQVESMKRILDLRNASKAGIEVVNRQRIVQEFGRKRVQEEDGWKFEGEPESGGSEVQAALLTQKIRNLYQHLQQNPRDIHNLRPLRTLVHQRAKVLKYLKRTRPGQYDAVLEDLGLERRGVEGELII